MASHHQSTAAAARRFAPLPPALASAITQRHIPCLDALRAFGAFLVVLFHFRVPGASGSLGVSVFFVVSGFLITWLLLQEESKTGSISLRAFYVRRSLRIFPAFYVYLAFNTLVRLWFHAPVDRPQAIAAALYVSNYYQSFWDMPHHGLEHTWSLAIEEQFYLVWPLAFLLLGSTRGKRLRFLLGAIGVTWIYRTVAVYVLKLNQIYVFESFETRADHLLAGCLLAVALWESRALGLLTWLTSRPWRAIAVLFALAISTAAHPFVSPELRDTVFLSLEPVLIAASLVVLLAHSRTCWLSWTGAAPVVFLGAISYSVYLYQQCLADLHFLDNQSRWIAAPAAIAVITILATLSYRFVERPCLRWKDRFAKARRDSSPALQSAEARVV